MEAMPLVRLEAFGNENRRNMENPIEFSYGPESSKPLTYIEFDDAVENGG
jgi:hypothetical protein